jgi:uncharacterized protein (DUF2267 family)
MTMSEGSARFLFPARVRAEVLAQHVGLRELLQRTLEATTAGLQSRMADGGLEVLAGSARELRSRFGVHLQFEERALVPILGADELWGPERVKDLLEEHERQRAELDTVVEGIDGGWDLERLALALRSLAADLLRDMNEEEEGCLREEFLQQPVIDDPQARRQRGDVMKLFATVNQQAVLWVKEMMAELRTDDAHKALHALRAGLHALRDRLSVDEAAQLAAQLPLLVRGIFFEGWDPSGKPLRIRHRAEFLALVREKYHPRQDLPADDIMHATFRVLRRHVSPGELGDVIFNLPLEVAQIVEEPRLDGEALD